MNSAKKILEFNYDADAFGRRAPQPAKPSKQNLDILEEIVKKHGDADHKSPDREDLHQIYHVFTQSSRNETLGQEFGTTKRIRQLSWALTFSENKQPRIVDTPQLKDALQLIENRLRTSSLFGVFNALLQVWDTPNADMLRAFVKKHLTDYSGTRKSVQKLKANMEWYCEKNSTTQLATELLRSNKKLSDVWSFLELPDRTQNYMYFSEVAKAFVSLNRITDKEVLTDVINFLEKHNNDKTNRSILSKLIEKLGDKASEDFRAPVQTYVLSEWQDPRIVGADVKWYGVSKEARKIFTKWLTEADLEFFFGIVAKACKDENFRYRKAFWLAYLEHITFCRPILHKDAEVLFKGNRYYEESRKSVATLSGGGRNQHAFIIQIGNHTCVEFSSTGAACYVYENVNLPFDLDEVKYHLNELRRTDLKRNNHTYTPPLKHWQPHYGAEKYSWQRSFAKWIEDELGIPIQNFEL